MRIFLVFLFGVLAAAIIIYSIPSYRQGFIKILSFSECDSPLPYKLGSIDQRFGLTTADVENDITQATDIWNKEEGKQLFTDSQNAQLTINFVYDQRQALDTAINQLNSKLKQNSDTLQQQVEEYKSQVISFKQRLADFENTVNKYNQEGGAPPDVYDQLIKQQNELKAEGEQLNARARQLNLSTDDYNSNVSVLNQDISQFNTALSQKPEEGLYDGNNNTITIYFANNQDELIHTLAHELGHSLGMVHVNDKTAIMYPYTTNSLTVSPDDRLQLDYVCREQSAIIHWAQVFDYWLYNQIQTIKHYKSS